MALMPVYCSVPPIAQRATLMVVPLTSSVPFRLDMSVRIYSDSIINGDAVPICLVAADAISTLPLLPIASVPPRNGRAVEEGQGDQ